MKDKKIKTIKALKKRLKKTLPDKISKVIESYESFLEQGIPDDAKGFNAHHNACKSAVVHAETLLKLAKWTDEEVELVPKEDNEEEDEILKIMNEARDEIDELKDDEA
ncbi:MAG: hypothetical protein ACK5N8_07380 [Alphaproteobacteria bacterium]